MKLIGVTGGVGTGKSTCAGMLAALGLPVVDTDQLARELVAPGTPGLAEIRGAFGERVVDGAGTLRREALAEIVFADASWRQQLESILHPRIREAWLAQAARWRSEGCQAGVVVIPLLFETAAEGAFAGTLCVACTPASQRQRLAARGWSAEQMAQRLAAQWPLARKLAAADYVIWTEGSLAVTEMQLRQVLEHLHLGATGLVSEPRAGV